MEVSCAPRPPFLIRSADISPPGRIYSDATGLGNLASCASIGRKDSGAADIQLRQPDHGANSIHIYGRFATVATIHELRQEPIGQKRIAPVDNEAAYAALTEGPANNNLALILIYSLWTIVAQVNISLWPKRAPSALNQAGAPSRGRPPAFMRPERILAVASRNNAFLRFAMRLAAKKASVTSAPLSTPNSLSSPLRPPQRPTLSPLRPLRPTLSPLRPRIGAYYSGISRFRQEDRAPSEPGHSFPRLRLPEAPRRRSGSVRNYQGIGRGGRRAEPAGGSFLANFSLRPRQLLSVGAGTPWKSPRLFPARTHQCGGRHFPGTDRRLTLCFHHRRSFGISDFDRFKRGSRRFLAGAASRYNQPPRASSHSHGLTPEDIFAKNEGWGLYANTGPPRREETRNDIKSFRTRVRLPARRMGSWPAWWLDENFEMPSGSVVRKHLSFTRKPLSDLRPPAPSSRYDDWLG